MPFKISLMFNSWFNMSSFSIVNFNGNGIKGKTKRVPVITEGSIGRIVFPLCDAGNLLANGLPLIR